MFPVIGSVVVGGIAAICSEDIGAPHHEHHPGQGESGSDTHAVTVKRPDAGTSQSFAT